MLINPLELVTLLVRFCLNQSLCQMFKEMINKPSLTLRITRAKIKSATVTMLNSKASALISQNTSQCWTTPTHVTLSHRQKYNLTVTLLVVCNKEGRWWSKILSDTKHSWLSIMGQCQIERQNSPKCTNGNRTLLTIVLRYLICRMREEWIVGEMEARTTI